MKAANNILYYTIYVLCFSTLHQPIHCVTTVKLMKSSFPTVKSSGLVNSVMTSAQTTYKEMAPIMCAVCRGLNARERRCDTGDVNTIIKNQCLIIRHHEQTHDALSVHFLPHPSYNNFQSQLGLQQFSEFRDLKFTASISERNMEI